MAKNNKLLKNADNSYTIKTSTDSLDGKIVEIGNGEEVGVKTLKS